MPSMNLRDWGVAVLVILILRAAGFINNVWFFIGVLALVGMLVLLQQNIPDGVRMPVITVYLTLVVVWLITLLGTKYMPLTTDVTNEQRILRDIMESERMNPAGLVGLDAFRQYCNAEEQLLVREITGQLRVAIGSAVSTATPAATNEIKERIANLRKGQDAPDSLKTNEIVRLQGWLKRVGELRAECSRYILDYYKDNKLGTPTKFNPWVYIWTLPAIAVVGFFAGWWWNAFWIFKTALRVALLGILALAVLWAYNELYDGGAVLKFLEMLSARGLVMGIMGILVITVIVDRITNFSQMSNYPLSNLVLFVGFMIVLIALLNYFMEATKLYDGLDKLLEMMVNGIKRMTT